LKVPGKSSGTLKSAVAMVVILPSPIVENLDDSMIEGKNAFKDVARNEPYLGNSLTGERDRSQRRQPVLREQRKVR
jgi:hypothetical protein